MHLCILADTIATDISQITLTEGHIPSIRGHQHQGRNGLTDFLVEPSVWFKVLVVDVVVVNCSQRQLSWEISRPEADGENSAEQFEDFCILKVDDCRNGFGVVRASIRRPKAVEKEADAMSVEDSFDLDELFDSLPGLVTDYERNVITASQFHDSLMKFLHLYILPSIVLTSRQTASMREGLRQEERFLQRVNEEIESTSRKLEAVTQSKTKLRRKFVPDINNSTHGDLPYSRSLIAALLIDINDEILDISRDLEVAQDDVDRAKRTSVTPRDSTADDLAAARNNRDKILQNYEGLLAARENIVATRNAIDNTTHGKRSRTLRKSDTPEHRIYEELTSIQEELIAVMHSLAEKKLLILSVKEAMKLTLAELETGADSCGVDVEASGFLKAATDVPDTAGSTRASLWMTLTEQVAEIIANPNHSLTKQHRRFCRSVAERCQAAIGERMIFETMIQLSDDTPGAAETTSGDVHSNDRSSSICTTGTNSIFYDTPPSDCCKVIVPEEGMRNSTNHHLPLSPEVKGKGGGIFRKKRQPSRPISIIDERRSTDSKTLYMLASSADDDAVLVFEEDKNYARKAINTLQKDINRHFEAVAEQLRVELRQKSTTSLWLSYESHFYKETIDYILTLYAVEYGAVTRALGGTIKSLRATDLSFDDSILVKMLQETEKPVESGTAVSHPLLHARSDVELSSRTKEAEVCRCDMNQPGGDTPLERLSSAANPEVDVEDFLPRLRQVSESEAVITDFKISSRSSISKLRKPSISEPSPCTVRKSIRIAHPFTTTIVYDRTICPETPDPNSATSETCGVSATSNACRGTTSNAVRRLKQELRPSRTMTMSPDYRHQFQQALDLISFAVEAQCLTTKLQQLTKCLRETSRQISIFCKSVRGSIGVATCCDELMDGVILLLCNLDESVLTQLHIQVMMLSDLMPPFFECNSFSFTLVQFLGAFQYLKDTILLRNQQTDV